MLKKLLKSNAQKLHSVNVYILFGVTGFDLKGSGKDGGGPIGIPSLPGIQKKAAIPVKSATSGSSRDLSDDDELDEDTEITQNMDPTDAKRVRRMLSNRESARRSKRRKQGHLTEHETQVSQLRIEISSLLKRLTDMKLLLIGN